MIARAGAGAIVALGLASCHDVTRFSNHGDHYEGAVVQAQFVRAGVDASARLCVEIDADHLQDGPGTLSSSDGLFAATPLRPIPQVWHDPLSTLSFGEGRAQNLLYVATPEGDAQAAGDVLVVLSLMDAGGLEVRLLRSAPGGTGGALFGVFALTRAEGACSF